MEDQDQPHHLAYLDNWTPGRLYDDEGCDVVSSAPLAPSPPRDLSPSDDVSGEGDQQEGAAPASPTTSLTGSLLAVAGRVITSAAKTAGVCMSLLSCDVLSSPVCGCSCFGCALFLLLH